VPVPRVREVVERALAAFDLAFSQWRDDSEISRCNRHASTEPFPVSARFADVLLLALRVAEQTNGAFDPTVKPLSDLYRAAKAEREHRLDEAALAAARARVDWRAVTVRDGAVVKARPDVQLDLDGIVAGAAADEIAEGLAALGLTSFYLEITGEVLCRGEKAPGVPWVIGVVDPASDLRGGDAAIRTLPLRDRALCTSGDYRNAIESDGRRVHHIFDPRTGHNPEHAVVSVSVQARSAALADALGTALLVAGEREGMGIVRRIGGDVGALFLVARAGRLEQVSFAWPE
jgi:thiamine biosynthesis lipoprotein